MGDEGSATAQTHTTSSGVATCVMHAVRFMNPTGNAHHTRAHIRQPQRARGCGRGGAGFTAHAASHAQTTEVQINAAYQIDPFPHNANPLENRLSGVGAASPVRLGTTHAVRCSTQTRSRIAARTNFAHYLSGLRAHVTEGSSCVILGLNSSNHQTCDNLFSPQQNVSGILTVRSDVPC